MLRRRRLSRKSKGQLPLPFGTRSRNSTTTKVRFQDFDPKRHKLADLDLRTIPRRRYTKYMCEVIGELIG